MKSDEYDHLKVFNRLAGEKQDVLGLVAYAVYKKQKAEWVGHFRTQNGRHPDWADFKSYQDTIVSGSEEQFRKTAETLLTEFASTWAAEQTRRVSRHWAWDFAISLAAGLVSATIVGAAIWEVFPLLFGVELLEFFRAEAAPSPYR